MQPNSFCDITLIKACRFLCANSNKKVTFDLIRKSFFGKICDSSMAQLGGKKKQNRNQGKIGNQELSQARDSPLRCHRGMTANGRMNLRG